MFDVVVVLGARVGVRNGNGKMVPAFHTEMRAGAAGVAWQKKLAKRFILTGGHNIGVRYDLDLAIPVFGQPDSKKEPDFSKSAKQQARCYRSEASVMAEIMKRDYDVPPEVLILEEESHTTFDNVQNTIKILSRLKVKKFGVGLLTNLFHMVRAFTEFRIAPGGGIPAPIYAEPLYVGEDKKHLVLVMDYYSTAVAGMTWKKEDVRTWLLKDGMVPQSFEVVTF